MARNTQPVLKRCRTLGVSPAVMGYNRTSNKNPGGQRRAKKSEYATQLTEKQKVKFVYGIQEKQFHAYYEKASKMLERRLDNVVYRLGFASTRREARQLVNHGHFTVNGKRVNIPSYLVKTGDVVAVCEKSCSNAFFKKLKEDDVFAAAPKWLDRDKNTLTGKVIAAPAREDIDFEIAEHLIVELYSK